MFFHAMALYTSPGSFFIIPTSDDAKDETGNDANVRKGAANGAERRAVDNF